LVRDPSHLYYLAAQRGIGIASVSSYADGWIDRSEEKIRGVGGARSAGRAHKDYEVWEAKGGNCARASESAKAECE